MSDQGLVEASGDQVARPQPGTSGAANLFFGAIPAAVARSLRATPGVWREGYMRLHHPSGITLWIANRPYGAEVERDGVSVWGGVSFLSTFGLSPGHWLLYAAIKRWERVTYGTISDVLSRAAIAKATSPSASIGGE